MGDKRKPIDHEALEADGWFGVTGWSATDVHAMMATLNMPKVSDDDADQWLSVNCDKLVEGMIPAGWDVMEFLLQDDPPVSKE